jgi:hypothetical protein
LSLADFPHRHTFYEIVLVTTGTGWHVVDSQPWPIMPPHFGVVVPGQVHHWEDARGVEGSVLLFNEDFLVCHPEDVPVLQALQSLTWLSPSATQMAALVAIARGVYGLSCLPIAAALLDFWQADDGGNYDMTGFTFRGHQYTDANGNFTLTTIVPGRYPGRTKHIHVKVQAPNQPILTTQLYFPGVPQNSTDTIFDARLLMDVRPQGTGEAAAFDFVLNVPQDPGGGGQPPGTSWLAGHAYKTGDTVTYNGTTYMCLQAHTSQPGWEPPNVPALWQAQ